LAVPLYMDGAMVGIEEQFVGADEFDWVLVFPACFDIGYSARPFHCNNVETSTEAHGMKRPS
jgi:hypothetical protein